MATKQQLQQGAARAAGRPAVPQVAVVAGAGANTNIAVAGIKMNDVLVEVLEYVGPGEAAGQAAVTDRTAATTIPADGNIKVSAATNTSTDRRLVVRWLSV